MIRCPVRTPGRRSPSRARPAVAAITENRIFDNSYEYRVNVGPVRFAVEAQLRNGGNSSTGNAFEGDIGFDYMGLSMDFARRQNLRRDFLADDLERSASGVSCAVARDAHRLWQLGCLAGHVISDNTFVPGRLRKYTSDRGSSLVAMSTSTTHNPNNPLLPRCVSQGGYNLGAVNNLTSIRPTGSCRSSGLA